MPLKKIVGVILYAAICVALAAAIYRHAMSVRVYLDDTDALYRYQYSPLYFGESAALGWAIDYPAVYHWVNHYAMKAFGVEIGKIPKVNREAGYAWNREHGLLAPWRVVKFFRKLNVVAICAALACLAALAKLVTRSWWWGLLIVAPLAMSKRFSGGIGSFIFTDAYLTFFLCLMALAWARFHLSDNPLSWRRVAVMGVIAGLAVSTKINAGLALAAYMAYAARNARGNMKLWKPLAAAAIAFAVFVAVNPIMWKGLMPSYGGPKWWGGVVYDMFERRMRAMAWQQDYYGHLSFGRRLAGLFPYWPFVPVFAFVIWKSRHARWFEPVALWAAFLGIGTALTIHILLPRYFMPVDLPVTVLVVLSAVDYFRRTRKGAVTGEYRVVKRV